MKPSSIVAEPDDKPSYRPRPRAIVVGLLAVAGMCSVGPYADMVGRSMQLGTLQFAPGAFGAFLIIVVLNRLFGRLRRKAYLRPPDLVRFSNLLGHTMLTVDELASCATTQGA